MLATVNDVKRVLGVPAEDESRDAEILAALEAVDSELRPQLKKLYPPAGPATLYYFGKAGNARLQLPYGVTVVERVVTDGYELPVTGWMPWRDLRYIRLLGDKDWRHDTVAVDYVASGDIPKALTEGTALLAAELVPSPASAGNRTVKSKSIGGYSFSLDTTVEESGVDGREKQALRLLRPFAGGVRARVV